MDDFTIRVLVQQQVAKDLKKVNAEIKKFKAEAERSAKKVTALERKLKDVGNTGKRAFKDAGQGAKGFGQGLSGLTSKLLQVRVIMIAMRFIVDLFKNAAAAVIKLDAALQDVRKVSNFAVQDMQKLENAAFGFAKKFGRSLSEVTAGFKIFAQQGDNVTEIITKTSILMTALASTTLTAAQAVEALTAAQFNFGATFAGDELIGFLSRTVDKWKAVEAEFPVSANDFANALKGLAQIAQELGLTMDELNGIVAAVGTVTRKSGQAIANSFRTIFARITGKEAIEAFDKIGVAILDVEGNFRPLGTILTDLNNKWKLQAGSVGALSQVQKTNIAQVLGMKRRYTDFLALLNNYDKALKATNISQNAFGEAAIAAQTDAGRLDRRIQMLRSEWEEFTNSLGRKTIPTLLTVAEVALPATIKGMKAFSVGVKRMFVPLTFLVKVLNKATNGFELYTKAIAKIKGLMGDNVTVTDEFAASIRRVQKLQEQGSEPRKSSLFDRTKAILEESDAFQEQLKDLRNLQQLRKKVNSENKAGDLFDFDNNFGILKLDKLIKIAEQRLAALSRKLLADPKTPKPEVKAGAKVKTLNKFGQAAAIVDFQISNMTRSIIEAAQAASIFDQDFNLAGFQVKQFEDRVKGFNKTIQSLKSKEVGLNFDLRKTDDQGNVVKFSDTKLEAKLKTQLFQVTAAITEAEKRKEAFIQGNLEKYRDTLESLRQQAKLQKEVNLRISEQTAGLRTAKDQAQGILSRLKDSAINDSKRLAIRKTALNLQSEIVAKTNEETKANIRASNITDKKTALINQEVKFKQQNLAITEQLNALERESLLIATARAQAVEDSLNNSISGNLGSLPDFLAQRKGTEEDLALRRKEIEFEIGEARKSASEAVTEQDKIAAANALAQAQRNLVVLEEEAKRVGSVLGQVVTGIFGPIADKLFEKNINSLVDALFELSAGGMSVGERISTGITGGASKAAVILDNKIQKALSDGGDKVAEKIRAAFRDAGIVVADIQKTAGDQAANNLSNKLRSGSDALGQSLKAAFAAGAQLLGQVIGGGGRGAGIGAGIGALVGNIIAPGIGGVLGGLAGGLIGGQFDKDKKFIAPITALVGSVDRNTIAIENNNKLLELNREFINAPTRFTAPPAQQGLSGGGTNTIQIFVDGGSGSGAEIGEGIAEVLERELGDALRSTRSRASNLGGR